MEHVSGLSEVLVSPTVTLNTGGTAAITSAAIDCLGYKFLRVTVIAGAIASGGDIDVFKLTESDASGGTYTDIAGATAGADPFGDTDDNKRYTINLDLSGVERFVKAVVSTGAAADTIVTVVGVLGKPDIAPENTTDSTDLKGVVNG